MERWCILRTKGQNTLPVARALAEAGFDVWTPMQMQSRRVPRSKARIERPVPIMPTYIFAAASRVRDLMDISAGSGFSVFHYFDRIPLVSDRDLEALRSEEARVKPKRQQRVYRKGETVRVPEGVFAGLSGIVERGDGRHTLVCFGGRVSVRIDTFLLRPNALDNAHPKSGAAA